MTPTKTVQQAATHVLARTRETAEGCLIWTGALNRDGYGYLQCELSRRLAHRVVYEALVGPIPRDLVIDHACHSASDDCQGGRCRHRPCVNPSHLELVTHLENVRRGTRARKKHCIRGHDLDEENTILRPGGHRQCKECTRASSRRRAEVHNARRRVAWAAAKATRGGAR